MPARERYANQPEERQCDDQNHGNGPERDRAQGSGKHVGLPKEQGAGGDEKREPHAPQVPDQPLCTRDPAAYDSPVEECQRRQDAAHDEVERRRVVARLACRQEPANERKGRENDGDRHRQGLEAAGFEILPDHRHPCRSHEVESERTHERSAKVRLGRSDCCAEPGHHEHRDKEQISGPAMGTRTLAESHGARAREQRDAPGRDVNNGQEWNCGHSGALSGRSVVTGFTVGSRLHAANPRATNDGSTQPNAGRGGWAVSATGALRAFALLALGATLAFPTQAATWEVIAEREGIIVSRRQVEGRAFPQLRAVGELPGTPYEILAVLLDVPAHVKWLPDCIESKTLRHVDAWRYIIYTRTDAPWPVSDRESVIENEVIFLEPPRKVKVTFEALPAPEVARARGTVRMKSVNGAYSIEAIDERRSLVQYELDADPAGALPAWLVTYQSTRNPFQTLAGLRARLQATRGQYRAQISRFPR